MAGAILIFSWSNFSMSSDKASTKLILKAHNTSLLGMSQDKLVWEKASFHARFETFAWLPCEEIADVDAGSL